MALNTQVTRPDSLGRQRVRKIRWGWWHACCIYTAHAREVHPEFLLESDDGPVTVAELEETEPDTVASPMAFIYHPDHRGCDLNMKGAQTLTRTHVFTDPDDGEVFELRKGDVVKAWG